MATTKYLLAERISVFIQGGRELDGPQTDIREIKLAVESVANKLLKMTYLSDNLAMGEGIPNGLCLAEYSNVPVTQYQNVSSSILPAMPVKLPRGMGVYDIYSPGDISANFIPLQWGDLGLLKSQPMLSTLAGFIGFIPMGTRIIYTQDLTDGGSLHPVVNMRLVVLDFTQYSDTDILPITADQEWDIISEVCKYYGTEPEPSGLDVPSTAVPTQPPTEMQQ